ncbi:MAG: TPM domain-containing protein, partial [Gemmatimonadota bacterium]|nr:TPM domain-containing protein [Gemmatimonadota bacterium]
MVSRRVLLGVLLVLLGVLPAGSQELRIPRPVGYVNDFASVISPPHEEAIDRLIGEVRTKSGGEIVVVTLPSLEGRSRDEVALQIGREWGVGKAGKPGDLARNTGAIVLVSIRDRKWKIELGYGANTFITAAEAGRIGREMVSRFPQGDFGGGIFLAVQGLARE